MIFNFFKQSDHVIDRFHYIIMRGYDLKIIKFLFYIEEKIRVGSLDDAYF